MDTDFDLDSYFARIGYSGSRDVSLNTLNQIMAAQTQTIPFENLDILLGRPIALDLPAITQKLVTDRRGGYCFEQNGLLLAVLQALGFDAVAISARARWMRTRADTAPRTHCFVRVDLAGEAWLADVGIGGVSLTSALRLAAPGEQDTPHDKRRIVAEGSRFFHQVRLGSEWSDVSEFTLEEMPLIDREIANWFTSTHPQSHFKHRLMAARAAPAGARLALLNDELTIRAADGHTEREKLRSPDELLEALARHFGLHFSPDTRFGSNGAAWPV